MRALLLLLAFALPAQAETLIAAHTIRPRAILAPSDVAVIERQVPGALSTTDEAVGLEARVVLYAGRPIRPKDLGPPGIVDRNQVVRLTFAHGSLRIVAEGRALDRGGVHDRIRVMNLSSRTTVTGTVLPDGTVAVVGALN